MLMPLILSLVTPIMAPAAQEDRVDAWGEDLFALVEQLEELHPDPYHGCESTEFEEAIGELYEAIPNCNDDQVIVEIMRLFGSLAKSGKEGHSGVYTNAIFGSLPIQLYRFEDGWFVVDVSDAALRGLIGARLTAIGATPMDEVVRAVAPLLATDNQTQMLAKLPDFLTQPGLLAALGIVEDRSLVPISFVLASGESVTRSVPEGQPVQNAFHLPTDPQRLWLSDPTKAWWIRPLEEDGALYVQFNVTQARAQGDTLAAFAAKVTQTFDDQKLKRVVLDVRCNGGGDNTTFGPLVSALKEHAAINRPGVLYALTGRGTFSAAGNFITALERETEVILVGEPTGGGPNQYGDATQLKLPYHPEVFIRVATRYHEFDPSAPNRLTHEAHVSVPLTSSHYFQGVDPVLERALGHKP